MLLAAACAWVAPVAGYAIGARASARRGARCPAPRAAAAIVTGGTGGIGYATAQLLAARGDDIVVAYWRDDARATAVCEELRATHGVRAAAVRGDLTDEAERERTVARIFENVDADLGGEVSAFVHAAGFFHPRLLEVHLAGAMANFTMYDQYQSIYPKAFVSIAEGAIERMADGKGRIVCITNPGCNAMQTPRVGYDVPGQGKATMEFLVRMYAMRLAARGLCVNAVSPGYTDTKEWDKARAQSAASHARARASEHVHAHVRMPDCSLVHRQARMAMGKGDMEEGRKLLDARMLSRSPMRRWASADEIAQTVHFLCAEQTGLITGATLPVDGGLHLT